MKIKPLETFDTDTLKPLYRAVKWTSYLKDDASFRTMFARSFAVLGAYLDGELVGLIRAVGDGSHILYIQDIIVLPKHQRKGIGSQLLARMIADHAHIRQKVLLADAADERARKFYEAQGFHEAGEKSCVCFLRFD